MPNCWFCYKDAGDANYHKSCSKKFFGTPEVPELELNDQLLQELAEQTVNKRIAVTGVQPKLSVTIQKNRDKNRLTIVGLWSEYILKPQHHYYPSMPETEDVTMHLASVFKIHVCDHTLIKASNGTLVYLAKRFDRKGNVKIHVEDFCQLSEFLTENKYKGSYEKAGKLILKHCTYQGLAAINYFELVLFCYLSGNNDMHLKNFSLIHNGSVIELSPAYDLLNVRLVNPKDDEELALTLNAKKKKIKLTDFIFLANALNIPSKAWQNSFRKFSSRNEEVKDVLDRSFLDTEQKKMYAEIWMKKQEIFDYNYFKPG